LRGNSDDYIERYGDWCGCEEREGSGKARREAAGFGTRVGVFVARTASCAGGSCASSYRADRFPTGFFGGSVCLRFCSVAVSSGFIFVCLSFFSFIY
jgi:hypothetical protein